MEEGEMLVGSYSIELKSNGAYTFSSTDCQDKTLANVPADAAKTWKLTKTNIDLTISCNGVQVTNSPQLYTGMFCYIKKMCNNRLSQ